MKSFAISYRSREKHSNPTPAGAEIEAHNETKAQEETETQREKRPEIAEVHINIWKVHVGTFWSKTKFFFDFGLRIPSKISSVCLFVPFEFEEKGKDFDLVRNLKESNQLLCTVFNMDLKSDSSQKDPFSKVINEETGEEEICLCQLGASMFTIEKVSIGENGKSKVIGSLLKIDLPQKPKTDICKPETPLYIRFRIEPKRVKDTVSSEHISNDLLQDAFSEIDMIDFRLNEQRDIHTDVVNKVTNADFAFFSFNKVHLFFMAETKENIQNGSSLKIDSRLLERELWKNYIPSGAKETNYIAHHWKKRKEKIIRGAGGEEDTIIYTSFKDYRIFFTSIYPKIKWIRLAVYLSVIILLSWTGSILSFDANDSTSQYKDMAVAALLILVIIYSVVTRYRLFIRIFRR